MANENTLVPVNGADGKIDHWVETDSDGYVTKYDGPDKSADIHCGTGEPAMIYADGTQYWLIHGKRHRVGAPAVLCTDGSFEYWVNGELHRTDGPADIDWEEGSQGWYYRSIAHCDCGPAMIYGTDVSYYLAGEEYSPEEWEVEVAKRTRAEWIAILEKMADANKQAS